MSLTIEQFLMRWNKVTNEHLEEVYVTPIGLQNPIKTSEINRPGLSLAGYFDHFVPNSIHVLGNSESGFLKKLCKENDLNSIDELFTFPISAFFFTNHNDIPEGFVEACRKNNIPLFRTNLETRYFFQRASRILEDEFSPQVTIHGVLVEVYGVGILLRGKSGVGKSETALELIERGHRFIADDLVTVNQLNYHQLEGRASELAPYFMEIRGLGIMDIKALFGIRAVRERVRIELVIQLVHWDEKKEMDRLGISDNTFPILDVLLPYIELPVRPGRNIPIIVETAAINARAKKLGYHSARDLEEKVMNYVNDKGAKHQIS